MTSDAVLDKIHESFGGGQAELIQTDLYAEQGKALREVIPEQSSSVHEPRKEHAMTTHGSVPGGPAESGRRSGAGKDRSTSRWVVALVLLAVAVVFVVENRDLTEIRLLIPVVLMPLWAALAITLVIGLVVGWLVGRRRR